MRYRLTGKTPRTLAGGNTLAPGDEVTLTSEECEHADTAWLLAEGLLKEAPDEVADDSAVEEPVEETPPAPKRKRGKASAGDTADAETDDEAAALPTDDDTNGGTDR